MSFAKLRPRRGTKTEWQEFNPVLMEGELGIEYPDTGIGTGLCKFKLGDGFKKWSELPYAFVAENATSMDGGTVSTYHNLQFRRGTTDEWELADPILAAGEPVYDMTKGAIKVGDGEHSFKALDYIGYSWEMDNEYDFGDMNEGEIVPGPDDKDYDFGDMGGWGTDWSPTPDTGHVDDPSESDAGYGPDSPVIDPDLPPTDIDPTPSDLTDPDDGGDDNPDTPSDPSEPIVDPDTPSENDDPIVDTDTPSDPTDPDDGGDDTPSENDPTEPDTPADDTPDDGGDDTPSDPDTPSEDDTPAEEPVDDGDGSDDNSDENPVEP